MPDYIVGNKKYTEEEAINAAQALGYDLETWKTNFSAQVVAGNQSDPAVDAEANAGSEENTASNFQDTSSVFTSGPGKQDVKLTDKKYMGLKLDENGWIVSRSLLEGNNYNWSDNEKYNSIINRKVKDGTHAYDPSTGILHKLNKDQNTSRFYEIQKEVYSDVPVSKEEKKEYEKQKEENYFSQNIPTPEQLTGPIDFRGTENPIVNNEKALREEYEKSSYMPLSSIGLVDQGYVDFLETKRDEYGDKAIDDLIELDKSKRFHTQKKNRTVDNSYDTSYNLIKDVEQTLENANVESGFDEVEYNDGQYEEILNDLQSGDGMLQSRATEFLVSAVNGGPDSGYYNSDKRDLKNYIQENNKELYNTLTTMDPQELNMRFNQVTEFTGSGLEGFESKNYKIVDQVIDDLITTDDNFSTGFDLHSDRETETLVDFGIDINEDFVVDEYGTTFSEKYGKDALTKRNEEVARLVKNEVVKLVFNDSKLKEKVLGPAVSNFKDLGKDENVYGLSTSTLGLSEKEQILATAKANVFAKQSLETQQKINQLQKNFENIENPQQSDIDKANAEYFALQDELALYTSQMDINVAALELGKLEFEKSNFKMSDEFIKWRDGKIAEGDFVDSTTDFGGTVIQGLRDFGVEYFYGTASMIDRLLLAGTELIVGESEYMDIARSRLDFMDRKVDMELKGNTFGISDVGGSLYNDGFGWRSSFKTLGNLLPFTLAVAGSVRKGNVKQLKDAYKIFGKDGGFGAKGLKWGNIGVKTPTIKIGKKTFIEGGKKTIGSIDMNTVRMGQTAYFGTVRDNYNEAKAMGLDEGGALIYANSASLATAVVQGIMPDSNFFNTAAGKSLLGTFKTNLKQAASKEGRKVVAKQFFANLAGELGEEEVELLLTDATKVAMGLSHETGFLDAQVQYETVMGTLLLSGSTSAATSPGLYNNTKKAVYRNMRADVTGVMQGLKSNVDFYQNFYDRAVKAGKTDLANRMLGNLKEAQAALKYGEKINNAISFGGEFVTDNEIDLYVEKQQLIDAKKRVSADGSSTTTINTKNSEGVDVESTYDLEGINSRIKEIDNTIAGEGVTKNLDVINKRTTEGSKKVADQLGIKYDSFTDDVDADGNVTKSADQKIEEEIKNRNEANKKSNKDKAAADQEEDIDVKRVGDNGFIVQYKDGRQEVIINESKSETAGAVTVAQHEILHGVLNETLRNNPKAAQGMASGLKGYVDQMISEGYTPSAYLGMSLQAYQENSASVQAEEMLTFFSDGLTQGYLKFDESIFTKLGDVIRQSLQNIGIKGIKFDTGRDVYNFIKDYNKSIASGKGLKGSLLEGAQKGFKGSLVDGLGSKSQLELATDQIFTAKQSGYGAEIVNLYTPFIKKYVFGSKNGLFNDTADMNTVRQLQSKVLSIVKEHNKTVADIDAGVSLYDKISNLFAPEGTKATTKSSKDLYSSTEMIMGIEGMDAEARERHVANMTDDQKTRLGQLVGFEYTNEVNKRLRKYNKVIGFDKVKDDILADITYGTTKKGKSGREVKVEGIVDIVKRYDGSIELNRWINGQLDNKIQGIVNSYNLGKETEGFDTSGTKTKQTIKPKDYRKLKDSNLFSNITLKDLKNNVIRVVRVLKTSLNQKVSKNVTIPPWIREFKKEIGKQNDLIIKQTMGGLKNNKLTNFLIKNKKAILENSTTTYLGTAIPNALQKSVDGKFTTEWQGKKIDFESSAETGRTSGIELAKRKVDISDAEFLSNFGEVVTKKGKPVLKNLKRGKKESLAKHLAEEIGLELIEGDVEVQNELAKNQQKHNIVNASLDILQIGREIKRGNAKSNRSAEQSQTMLFDLMDMAIKEGGSSDSYLRYKSEMPKDIQDLADEIGLDTYFDEGKTGFKAPLLEWSDMPGVFKPYIDTYKSTVTAKGKEASMQQLADFSEAFIEFLPPELVEALPADMFSITYSYLDGAKKKKGTGKPGPYYYLARAKESRGRQSSDIKLPFNPAEIEIFNSASGLMKQITTILKKDISADQKRKEVQEKFGDRIAKSEVANIEALKYIMNEATKLIAKKPELTPGFLRWLESSTSNVKAQRGLTRLPLIQYVDGSMEADQTHVFYNEAVQFAVNRSTNIYEGKSAKFKRETSLEQFIEDRLKTHPPTSHLKFKGEHVSPAANVMLDLAKISLDTAAKINKLGIDIDSKSYEKQVNSLMTFSSIKMDGVLRDYNQTLGAEIFSAVQDDALGTTSKASDFRGLVVDRSAYNTFTTIDNIQAIEFIKRENLSLEFIKELTSDKNVENYILKQNQSAAISNALVKDKNPKGISVFDFDDTVARSSSNVLYTLPDGTKGKLNATEFAARSSELEAAGAKFDFSEFSKVVDGKPGPLTEKLRKAINKFGNKNVFILTARPQASAKAIQNFLKGLGINLKFKNITGLENGAAQAKADWIVAKAAEGYNDFYFADDAYKNVKAVQDALNIIDVKGKTQQAFVKSNKMSKDFNTILEQTSGVEAQKVFSKAKAAMRGANKGRFRFFLPPSAEDFMGLMYDFIGKGKLGNTQKTWIEENLAKPYSRGINKLKIARNAMFNEFGNLRKQFPDVRKKLRKKVPGTEFSYDQAVRVYLYNKAGYDVPGMSQSDLNELTSIVAGDTDLKLFADALGLITNQKEGYVKPGEYWLTSSIQGDLNSLTADINRKEFLKEFIENAQVIFSEQNLNKIEAIYGANFREALQDILYRMENGTNRTFGKNRLVNTWSNWINNSVGAIMFFNMRSALLQTLSTVNFVNWTDNNPMKAAMAFANQKQYWSDFSMIFNSPLLKERRRGNARDVNEAELANAVRGSKNKARAAFQYLLKVGFLPTQIADSFAISAGGATMYRNRVKTYLKQGLDQKTAEAKAFEDFSSISEEAQQSSDPAYISQQQSGPLGRFILAFQNTPMQYNRLMKKAARDLINRRGDWKTHVSKIMYYGAIQNFIFTAMQKSLFALLFEDEDYKCEGKTGEALKRCENYNYKVDVGNGMADTILRGSGLYGAVAATLKNAFRQYTKQEEKGFTADHTYTMIELFNVSPPIGSKARKIYSAIQEKRFNKDVIAERGFNLDSPAWSVVGNLVAGFTNVPMDRFVKKVNNIKAALDRRNEAWKRIAFAMGWNTWDLKAEPNETHEQIKIDAKARRKEEGKIKAKKTREENKKKKELMLDNMSYEERTAYELEEKRKRSEAAKKGAETRRRNKAIKDSIALANYLKNAPSLKQ